MNTTGPAGAIIRPVTGRDSPYLPAAAALLMALFPDYRRYVPLLAWWAMNAEPSGGGVVSHLWLVEADQRPVGLRIFHYLPVRSLGYGAFIGLLPAYRGRGLGSWVQQAMLAQLRADARRMGRPALYGCCSEVDPSAADRLAFFQRFGGIRLDLPYYEPPMVERLPAWVGCEESAAIPPRRMDLLFYAGRPGQRLGPEEAAGVAEALYSEYYRVPVDSWYLSRVRAAR